MTRVWTLVLGLALAGCAKNAPLDLSMKNNLEGEATLQPNSVELNHEKDGWISVGLSNTSGLADGKKVQVASEEVRKGTYLGARVAYTQTMTTQAESKNEGEIDRKITRKKKGEDDAADSAKDDDGGEIDRKISRGEPKTERKEGTATSDAQFCVTKKDGAVTLVLKQAKTGDVKHKVSGPEC